MTDMPNAATPRSVRDELRNAYKQASDFEGSLYSALFAALTMLEKQEARIDALESQESNLHVRLAALEAAQAETANMRNVITLQQGAIEDLLASVAMLNDEIASRPVAALEAAQPAPPPAPTVLYEGEAAVLKHGILLSTLGARIAMRGHKRVHIVVTALEDDES